VLMVGWSKATKAVWRQQIPLDYGDDAFGLLAGENAVVQTDSEDLVGPDGGVPAIATDHIEEASGGFVPEAFRKSGPRGVGEFLPMRGIRLVSEALAQVFRRAQGVVPKGLDLDRLAVTRGHHPVAHFGVHPGELHSRLAGKQQAVGVQADSV